MRYALAINISLNQPTSVKLSITPSFASIGMLCVCIVPLQAAVVANFTGGNGTASADQYAGIAGNGWTSAWQSAVTSPVSTPTATVINTTPINSGGNYLSVTTNGTTDGAIGRAFDGTGLNGGVDTTLPTTFSFDLRIDTLTGWDNANDYITVHAQSSAGTYNVSNLSTFFIRAHGASPLTGKNANEWLLYSGAGDGGAFSAANYVNSGMTIGVGTTYRFNITSYHATEKYDVSIFNGTTTVNRTGLGWRADASSGIQTKLAFNNKESAVSDAFTYSIDNISIIPEPSAALLGALGMLALLRRRRA